MTGSDRETVRENLLIEGPSIVTPTILTTSNSRRFRKRRRIQ
jgi:hypothetical protein